MYPKNSKLHLQHPYLSVVIMRWRFSALCGLCRGGPIERMRSFPHLLGNFSQWLRSTIEWSTN